MRIHVTGASGAGSSTLAAALASTIGGTHLETDDYFWLPTSPPYQARRDHRSRLERLRTDLHAAPAPVLAGSIMGWGADVEDAFDLIVFLYVEASIRLERLERREIERFGKADAAFLAWASAYDAGPSEGRSLASHRRWLARRKCRVLEIVGDSSVDERVSRVLQVA